MNSKAIAITVILLACAASVRCAEESQIGTKPVEWEVTNWINSKPLELKDLAGKVALIRWWTAPECANCRATAPALNEFNSTYHDKGLEVIGFYHHKLPAPLNPEDVKTYAKEFEFKFPVAIDPEWKTLKKWWIKGEKKKFTSVTFLIDRKGVIRHIHPGGQYVKDDDDYKAMKAKIEELLAEK